MISLSVLCSFPSQTKTDHSGLYAIDWLID